MFRSAFFAGLLGLSPVNGCPGANGGSSTGSGGSAQIPSQCSVDDLLDEARGYNVVTTDDYISGYSDAEGTVAVGGDFDIHSYSIGVVDPGTSVVMGDFTLYQGSVDWQIIVGGTWSVTLGSGSVSAGTPVDFVGLANDLEDASWELDAFDDNGLADLDSGTLTLSGTESTLNVFQVTTQMLEDAGEVSIDIPAGSAGLIKVSGTSLDWYAVGFDLQGAEAEDLFWSMPEVTDLSMEAIGVQGTVLAPLAELDFDDGQLNGHLFVDTFNGDGMDDGLPDGQINHRPFDHLFCP
jgi:choice-of-anchor A domain-containing protein